MDIKDQIIQILKQEVKPALGCTEPASIALACSVASENLEEELCSLELFVSGNIMKNAIAVSVPNTGMKGIKIAAAMGYVCQNSALGLEVLKNATKEQLEEAKKLLGIIKISIEKNVPTVYIKAIATSKNHQVCVLITQSHCHVSLVQKDGKTLVENPHTEDCTSASLEIFSSLSLRDIYDLACMIEEEKIAFLGECAEMNQALSLEGLRKDYGLKIGRTFQKYSKDLPKDLGSQILIFTTAASDARMGGAPLPAMTNSGSGNQGITATMPVVIAAKHLGKEKDLNRALFLSHLTAIYIHSKLPKLSALCAVTTAGIGSYAGIAWLFTQNFDVVSRGICNMIGDISGILCDGASNGCSMKVSTTVQSVFKSLLLALEQSSLNAQDGIVSDDADKSIKNLCAIASNSMLDVDQQILEIMLAKNP
ncbi:Serine dehydratase alpha chain [Helicobacter mustelae]|uniref:L-cysteine desulfidase family protein n=1 Tax=Helicobacter mustelae TaxID=217 RepID=UPI000E06CAC9|nr:L-serine ammonia-lyase, iron-sulfur-dependent, subunit alpha [Helicobacter mustelae]STP12362.1 Serine dehydratase alpha chain [Helicobacter mustelae]